MLGNIPEVKFSFDDDFFNKTLEEIDKELQTEDIPARQRSFLAFERFKNKVPEVGNVSVILAGLKKENSLGYTSYNLGLKISEWFTLKYEHRMNVGEMAIQGRMILLVQNEPYKVDIPLVLGSMKIIWDSNYENNYAGNTFNLPQRMEVSNIIAKSITQKEIDKLSMIYKRTVEAFYKYRNSNVPYMLEALEDERKAIDGIIKAERYGQSKWDSNQFIEKVLKGIYIKKAGMKVEKTHDLSTLSDFLSKYHINVNADAIEKIQCTPGARYGEDGKISRSDAVTAHVKSLQIFRSLMDNNK